MVLQCSSNNFYVHAALEHVQAMYELGTYIKCTNYSVYVNVCKSKKSALARFEPRTSRREFRHLNTFASGTYVTKIKY
jgi:hypothetical protein